MDPAEEFAAVLRERLQPFGCCEFAEGRIGQVDFAGVLSTPRRADGRILCAVARLPEGGYEPAAAGRFVQRIRRSLAKRYAGVRWFKRLGTYTVLLAGSRACEKLRGHEGRFIDSSGLHVNVLLGTVLIDLDAFRVNCDNIWGLIDTGDQFRHIQGAAEEWCRAQRLTRGLERTSAQVLSVA